MASYYSFSPAGAIMPVQDGKGEITFTVKNMSDRLLQTRYDVIANGAPGESASADWTKWLKVERSQRAMPAGGTEQVAVRLEVPPKSQGKYSFLLRSVSIQRPDEDFTDGPVVAFELPKPNLPTEKPKIPWLWIILGVVALLLIIGIALFFVLKPKGVPDVTGKTVEESVEILTRNKLNVGNQRRSSSDKKAGTVISEDPPAGSPIPEDKRVNLVIAGPSAVSVPNVVGFTVAKAVSTLKSVGLTPVPNISGQTGTIFDQNPRSGISVAPGEKVDLFIKR